MIMAVVTLAGTIGNRPFSAIYARPCLCSVLPQCSLAPLLHSLACLSLHDRGIGHALRCLWACLNHGGLAWELRFSASPRFTARSATPLVSPVLQATTGVHAAGALAEGG